tara:strand:- start:5449 stop:5613 length:165 start_codon:yes stop_codon:yes gene_type:complete
MKLEKNRTKKEFEEMLRYFDLPHKKMKNDTYLIGEDIVIRFMGALDKMIGLEED